MFESAEYHLEVWPDEYDTTFLKKLDYFLIHEIGATRENNEWVLGGSQKVTKFNYRISGHQVIVKAETYMGILICGPKALVGKIADKLKKKIKVP